MKKHIIIFIILGLILVPNFVSASTNTYIRTDSDLRIPDKINYKSSMYNNVINTPSIDANEKVYDFADILTDNEEQDTYNKIIDFINYTNLDLAVVTINTNPKNSTMEYADDFYDYNNFSINGLVYIIDMENREFYISTAGTAILYFDNNRIESTLTNMDNSMYLGNYQESINILIYNLKKYYDQGYSSNSTIYTISNGKVIYKTPYFILTIISLIISVIIIIILSKRNKPVKLATDSLMYLAKDGIKITNRQDNFLTTHTTSVYSPPVSSSNSSSSGSSFHSSSSGSSHGGGGHHF